MTVKETLDRILEDLPEEDQHQLLDFAHYLRWRQEQVKASSISPADGPVLEEQQDAEAGQEAARFSLPNAKLKALAARHKPPQSWFEEVDKPF